jgi:hypothetical protein
LQILVTWGYLHQNLWKPPGPLECWHPPQDQATPLFSIWESSVEMDNLYLRQCSVMRMREVASKRSKSQGVCLKFSGIRKDYWPFGMISKDFCLHPRRKPWQSQSASSRLPAIL